MQIKKLMTPEVEVAEYDMTLQQAATKMKALDVGALPVREGAQIVGMLTDRDITVRAVASGRNPAQTVVADIMTVGLVYCYEDETVEQAAQIMAEQQVRRLPVLSRERGLVGIVSLGDLAVEAADDALMGETLEEIPEPAKPFR